jgi:subtilase family serine protease
MRPPSVAMTATCAMVVAMALAPATQVSAASADRVHVTNAQPSLSGARTLGASDPAQRITVKLYLRQRNQADLAARIRAVSNPASSSHSQYLTPAQFRAQYSPTAATIDAVRTSLAGYGILVAEIPANRAYVAAQGSVAQFQQAFTAPR